METEAYRLGDSVVVRGDDRIDGIDMVFQSGSDEPAGLEVTVSMDRETAVDFADWIVEDGTEDLDNPTRGTTPWG